MTISDTGKNKRAVNYLKTIEHLDPNQLERMVEALLFVAGWPVSAQQLAQALQASEEEVAAALARLRQANPGRGIRLQEEKGHFQLVSAPEAAPYVERLLGLDLSAKLSRAALETLAVVAYRQPITRAQIEAIRGVDCDGVIRTLAARGLICEVGRLEQVGRPILFGTTPEFLQYFGLQSLADLPPLEGSPQLSAFNADGYPLTTISRSASSNCNDKATETPSWRMEIP